MSQQRQYTVMVSHKQQVQFEVISKDDGINQSAVIYHSGPMTGQGWRLEFTKEILAQYLNTLLFVTSVSSLMLYT